MNENRNMKHFNIEDIPSKQLYSFLTSAVIPRPIAFASTIDSAGKVNLSPFSYFNVFSSNPPILVFSPVRRSADGTTKDTYENVHEVGEVVINLVNHHIVHEMSLTSTGYAKEINEFHKAGLTEVPSIKIRPPRVKESPIAFECKVNEIKDLGQDGGAGSLIICEVVHIHVDERVLNEQGTIDPFKLDAVARLGGGYYSRVSPDSIFEIPKPISGIGVGVDALPESWHHHFTGREMAMLAGIDKLPSVSEVKSMENDKLNMIKALLHNGDIHEAWSHLRAEEG